MVDSWIGYSILTIIFWGIWGVFGKLASRQLSGWAIYIISFLPSLVLITISFFIPRLRPNWVWPAAGFATLAGIAGMLGALSFYQALAKGQTGTVVALTALYPALTVVLAMLLLKEQLSPNQIIGIIFALLAGYLLAR